MTNPGTGVYPGTLLYPGGGSGPAASGQSLMGATVFQNTYQTEYPSVTSDVDAAVQFDKILNGGSPLPRTPGLNARKVYYKDVSVPSQHWQTSPTSPHPAASYCSAGIFCICTLQPNPAGVTSGGALNSTGLAEANAMQQTIAMWQSLPGPDGTTATNPGQAFVLTNEVNYGGKFSSAAAYIAYAQAYGPYITMGSSLVPAGYSPVGNAPATMAYLPLLASPDSGTAVCDYFPGKSVGAYPLVTDVYVDFYCNAFDDTGFTSTSSLSANTKNLWAVIDMVTPGTGGSGDRSGAAAGCGFGIGEFGLAPSLAGVPTEAVFIDYMTYLTQVMTCQAVGSKGVPLSSSQPSWACWYDDHPAPAGPNYIDTGYYEIPYLQAFYDATIQAPPAQVVVAPVIRQNPAPALMRAATW